VTVTGGKWTTYRRMAADVLERAMSRGALPRRPGGHTVQLPLVGASPGRPLGEPPGEHLYGSEAAALRTLPGADHWLWCDGAPHETRGLSEAMVRFAVRHEMARDVEDVLARRSRLLFLDAARAGELAPAIDDIVFDEIGRRSELAAFDALARQYRHLP
jgi:glycerol-3-phosphate dehydrogenase